MIIIYLLTKEKNFQEVENFTTLLFVAGTELLFELAIAGTLIGALAG